MGEKDEGERSVENAACWTGGRASSSPTALAISLFVLRRNLCLFRRGLVLFIVLVDVVDRSVSVSFSRRQSRRRWYLLAVEYAKFGDFRAQKTQNTKGPFQLKIIPSNICSCVHQHETSRLRHHTCPKTKNFTVNAALSKQ